ncbi:Aste57867_7949 [Aphanomyces stellatus]|uniref:Aste57867_7949 protein n=1 Tax=Aphanomyces stellatus TaxID=120398 RepID=A0A485KJ13_9STRA|nr:hypothetical protein As57867_007919 [Aphanomyces stellatus]VFT84842.1 Aste57867_7949 [Aphanomyces stellatus]
MHCLICLAMMIQPLLKTSLLKNGDLAKAVEKLRKEPKTTEYTSPTNLGVRRSLKESSLSPRFRTNDYIKVYRGNSLRKARVLQVTSSEYYVHYQGCPSDMDEFVPHYRVIEDREMKSSTTARDDELEQLREENRRLKAALTKSQERLERAEDDMAQEWKKECSVLQAKCMLVSDHCKEAVQRVYLVLEEKQRLIDSWNCVVCTTTPVDCALVACGHMFCLGCSAQFKSCPICRREFIMRLPLFKP